MAFQSFKEATASRQAHRRSSSFSDSEQYHHLRRYFCNLEHPRYSIASFECPCKVITFSWMVGCTSLRNLRLYYILVAGSKLQKSRLSYRPWVSVLAMMVMLEATALYYFFKFTKTSVNLVQLRDATVQPTCTYSTTLRDTKSRVAVVAIVGYNAILFGLLVFVTFKTRNLPSSHSEFTMLLSIVVSLVFALIVIGFNQSNESGYHERKYIVWILAMMPLLMQLIPRGIDVYRETYCNNLARLVVDDNDYADDPVSKENISSVNTHRCSEGKASHKAKYLHHIAVASELKAAVKNRTVTGFLVSLARNKVFLSVWMDRGASSRQHTQKAKVHFICSNEGFW
ncbi:hypothetical protein BDR26DRAFT_505011 [Obelidium mucronatum]|nr:hypothetical protein BDR26DRAFT_505011 [Obelidium mucronatum]